MKKIVNEQLYISDSNPIKARAYDYKSFTYPWHFHGEYEILYVEKGFGQCIIGDGIIDYTDETLLLFGSSLPHCMQNPPEYDNDESLRVNGAIIQFEKDFMQYSFAHYVQFTNINNLLNESNRGVKISIKNKPEIATLLKQIPETEGMEQIISFLPVAINDKEKRICRLAQLQSGTSRIQKQKNRKDYCIFKQEIHRQYHT